MMIRQYKIHTDLDGSADKIFDMNDGKIRFYQPSDLGITTNTNIWSSGGIGVFGDSSVGHPPLEFQLETFGDTLEENYKIFNDFIGTILKQKYVTLEYKTSLGTFFADVKLSKVTKTEGYGFNGTFSEKISFDNITMWYVYEQLRFSKIENGKFNENTKIHTNSRYTYSSKSYVYSTEDNIDRFSKWSTKDDIFSFIARLTPSKNVGNKKYGLRFLNSDANEYSAIVFNLPNEADFIQINTDINDEYYQAMFNGQAVNMFSALDFQRFRTRLFEKGSMELIGLDSVEMNIKRKVDFV